MGRFVLRKTAAGLAVPLVSSVVVFLGLRAIPGDPATALAGDTADPATIAAVRHEYLLDRPLPVQYGRWLWLARRGNLGRSESGLSVARRRDERADHYRARSVEHDRRDLHRDSGGGDRRGPSRQSKRDPRQGFGCARAVRADLLARPPAHPRVRGRPALASRRRRRHRARSNRELRHLALPCLALGTGFAAVLARHTRSSTLGALDSDYIRTARRRA